MHARSLLGRAAEDYAARMYERSGFTIVARNYRCAQGEIDLIAVRGRLVVFCEVKCRRSERWGAPSEAVGSAKQLRIRRVAAAWLRDQQASAPNLRFDVVSVIVRGGRAHLDHIPNAF